MTSAGITDRGLEDVVALTSTICFIDGKQGKLIYQGYDLDDLVANSSFEETAYLLWHGELPTAAQLKELNEQLLAERAIPDPVMDLIRSAPKNAHPMEVLRTAVSALAFYDPDSGDMSKEANIRKAVRLTAKFPTIVAAFERSRTGKESIAPDNSLSHAGNLLYMLKGEHPDEYATKVVDAALIIHADHELNASTFAARVTAATLSDIHSAVTSAIGALKGPLHGGANEAVMKMVNEIGTVDNVEPFVHKAFETKRLIMGFGHRVYRTYDPRAVHLKQYAEELGKRAGDTKPFDILTKVEGVVMAEKSLWPNVDFFSGAAYQTMGIPIDQFTPVFAVSRVSGWTAHVLEQYSNNRLIRPRAEYVGPEERKYVPMSQRS
jgi:citrate synthase